MYNGENQVNNFMKLVTNLLKDESGQDLIEYALVAGLVGVAAVLALSGVATKINSGFNSIGSTITSALP
jgi:pilus assembly protein Flp/PilA